MRRRPRRMCETEGQSLVETALTAPLLVLILIGTLEAVRALFATIALTTAVQVGAQYGALSAANAANAAGIEAAVRAEFSAPGETATNPTVTSSTGTDTDGERQVTVSATFTFTTLFAYPGVPQSVAITRSASQQVRR